MIRSFNKKTAPVWFALGLAWLLAFAPLVRVQAADHGDAPATANDLGADVNDIYMFLDPNDNSRVVFISTFHGFIVPGENANFGVFDPAMRYRFELETTGDPRPDAFIDVTFSRRLAANGVPQPQMATVRFTGLANNATFTAPSTNPSATSATAPPPVVTDLGSNQTPPAPTGINFYAGLSDDPFFFDIPAFGRFSASVRAGTPNPVLLQRGRDSFAGYNTLAICISVPAAMLRTGGNNQLGFSFAMQRRSPEYLNVRTGQIQSFGRWVNVDRQGVPAVNVALVPFAQKDDYNAATPVEDAGGRFAAGIVSSLQALRVDATSINIFASLAVTRGDILRMDFTIPNSGTGGGDNIGGGFPNGRRLRDDVIDTELFLINNRVPISDNANANDVPFLNTFPFLGLSQQPREPGTLDDNTRN
jgi:hypothetical protein